MTIRNFSSLTVKLTKNARSLKTHRTILSNCSNSLTMANDRSFFKCAITPNIKLNSVSEVMLEKKDSLLPKLITNETRPLVILLEYLKAKEKHIKKFIDLYIGYGFDVLQIHLTPLQLLLPKTGSQMVAKDVAQFLLINESFSPIVVHGFSVGGYLWGEILVQFSKNLDSYQPVADRIKCKIFDSAVDVTEISKGLPLAVFPKNPPLRFLFEKYLSGYLTIFYEQTTRHYNASRKQFSGGTVKCPTLMITSNADPMSSVTVNETVYKELSALNLECYVKVFEGSKHVAHFKRHEKEYIAEIEALLKKVDIMQTQKLKAKL